MPNHPHALLTQFRPRRASTHEGGVPGSSVRAASSRLLRGLPRLGAALAALVAGASVHAADATARELPTPVRGGETVLAAIDPPGEADEFAVALFPGDRLQVKARDQGPARGLVSTLSLAKPGGGTAEASISGNGTNRVALTYTAVDGGDHVLRIVGGEGEFTGSNGNYSAQFRVKRTKPAKAVFAEAAGGAIAYRFGASAGSTVTISAATKRGGFDLTSLVRPDGSDEPGFAAALKSAKNRRSASAKKFVLTGGSGTWELRGTYDAGSSVKVSAAVNHGEKPRRRVLGAEPKFDRLLLPFPSHGIVGTAIHVVGTDFTFVDVPAGDDVYPRFFVGSIEIDRAVIDRPNGSLYRFPAPAGLVERTSYDITVVNADGQTAVADDAFTVVPPPTATSLSAVDGGTVAAGPAGGRRLRVAGADFRAGTVVLFGTVIAQPTVVLSDRIDVTAPAHAPGSVVVTVRDEFGQASPLPGTFTYLDVGSNRVTSIDRAFLQALGGETVTVTGSDIGTDSTLTFDGADAGATRLSSTQMRFTAPARPGGTSVVRVVDALEQSSTLSVSVRGFLDQTTTHVPAPNAETNHADGWRATRIVRGDVTGEGRTDLVLLQTAKAFGASSQRSRVRILSGNPNGSFQDVTGTAIPSVSGDEDWRARDAVLVDLDGDLDLDLAIVTDEDVESGNRSSLRLLRNNGSGVFTDQTSAWAPSLTTYGDRNQGVAIVAGDFDGDLDQDLAIVHTAYFTETIVTVIVPPDPSANPPVPGVIETTVNHFPALRILRNSGTGALTRAAGALPAVSSSDTHQWQASALAAADLDGDLDLDLVLTRDEVLEDTDGSLLRSAFLLRNSGAGVFGDQSSSLPSASAPDYLQADRIVVADADGDGDPDVFLVSNTPLSTPSTTPALRLLRNASGTFTSAGASVFPAADGIDVLQAENVAVGDLDGDGAADLVLVSSRAPNNGGRACRVLRRSGSSWVSASLALPSPATSDDGRGADVTLADLGGDGDLDIVIVRDEADETVRNTRLLFNPRN